MLLPFRFPIWLSVVVFLLGFARPEAPAHFPQRLNTPPLTFHDTPTQPPASPFHQRRKLTLAPCFAYRADGLMTGATVNGQTYGATYGDQGLLTGRSNPFRSVLVSGRDDLGRIIDLRTTAGGVQVLREYTPYVFSGSTLRLPWDGRDKVGQVYSERAGAGAWNEARHFDYDASGRLTYEENEPWPASGVESTGFYYDNGPYATTGGLGVRTSRLRDRDLNQLHGVPAVGTYGRVLSEIVRDTPRAVPLSGTALGAATVKLTLDGRDLVPVSFGGWQDAQGLWSATVPIAPGFHLLTATATHPSGWVAPAASSQFQVLPRPETITNGYDEMGNVATRTWRDAQNQILKSQTLTWDARGRLVQVVQTGLNPFTWTALYDGLDRRLRTTYTPAGGAAVTSNSTFDPEVEFLELGLAINGQAAWKVYGPDLSGSYGGLEGLGGLEAVLGADGVTRGIVNDWFGNVAGQVAAPGAPLTWSQAQYLAWGPAPGWSTPVNDGAKPLHELLGYRGLTLDPTGYQQMGLRPYDPQVSRWLSPDSLGHAASLSLYDYCDNDPLNRFDPDGRVGKSAYSDRLNTQANSLLYSGPDYRRSNSMFGFGSSGIQTSSIDPYAKPFSFDLDAAITGTASLIPFAKNGYEFVTGRSFTTPGMSASRAEAFSGLGVEAALTIATLPMGGSGSVATRVAGSGAVRIAETSAMRSIPSFAAKGAGTATDQAVFWSGRNGANFSAATEFAESSGRLTLEMTPGGRVLPAFSDSTRGLWESASRSFAQEASGTVNAFTVGARPGSVFNTIEKPALLLNPNVNKINVIDQLHPERTRIIYPNRP